MDIISGFIVAAIIILKPTTVTQHQKMWPAHYSGTGRRKSQSILTKKPTHRKKSQSTLTKSKEGTPQ